MNNRIFPLLFVTVISGLFPGCSQTLSTSLSQQPETILANHSKENPGPQSKDLKWLLYADPKADANLAIEKHDFTLLAFAGRVTTFPGIDSESSPLQQQCGYRLLANTSDALTSENELNLRKKLYQYAATFNQLVSAACQKRR